MCEQTARGQGKNHQKGWEGNHSRSWREAGNNPCSPPLRQRERGKKTLKIHRAPGRVNKRFHFNSPEKLALELNAALSCLTKLKSRTKKELFASNNHIPEETQEYLSAAYKKSSAHKGKILIPGNRSKLARYAKEQGNTNHDEKKHQSELT